MIVNSIGTLASSRVIKFTSNKNKKSGTEQVKSAGKIITIPLATYLTLISLGGATTSCSKYDDFTVTADSTAKNKLDLANSTAAKKDTAKPSANTISVADILSLLNKEKDVDSNSIYGNNPNDIECLAASDEILTSPVQKQLISIADSFGLYTTDVLGVNSLGRNNITKISYHDGHFNRDYLLEFNKYESTNESAVFDERVLNCKTGDAEGYYRYKAKLIKPNEFLVKKYVLCNNPSASEAGEWDCNSSYRFVYKNGIIRKYDLDNNRELLGYKKDTPTSLLEIYHSGSVGLLSDICIETE